MYVRCERFQETTTCRTPTVPLYKCELIANTPNILSSSQGKQRTANTYTSRNQLRHHLTYLDSKPSHSSSSQSTFVHNTKISQIKFDSKKSTQIEIIKSFIHIEINFFGLQYFINRNQY